MQISVESRRSGADLPAFATRAVLAIAGVVAVAQLVSGVIGGYWFDEAYMLAIGRHHLARGSADQPPIAPALAAAMDWLDPGSLVVLRIPAILATAAAVVVAALVAREFGADRRAQMLTAGAQATALWFTMDGHWLTPYTLEPVQWLLLAWLLVRWVRIRDDRLLLAMGAVAGIAAETKFQVILLCAVLAAAVASCGPRELLRRPMLWAGAGIGALLALPTLVWQARNGWPQLHMSSVLSFEAKELYGGRPGIAVALIVMAGVAGTVLALYGIWRLLRGTELRPYRFLGVSAVVLYIVFIATCGRPYYLGGFYGVLFAAGAVGLQRRRQAGGRRGWVAWPAYALSVAAAAGMLAVSVTSVKTEAPLRIARLAETAYRSLPERDRGATIVMGQSYIVAAYVDVYAHDLSQAYSSNRSYGYFTPPPDSARDVLYIGTAPDELRDHFGLCRRILSDRDDLGTDQKAWLCTDRREPWARFWPGLRHLDLT